MTTETRNTEKTNLPALPGAPEFVCGADDPNWLELRKTGIGASECAAACGISRWSTPFQVYGQKVGLIPDTEENDAMRFGNLLEPVIASEFQRHAECDLFYRPGLFRSLEYPFVLATPDGIIDSQRLAEFKTMNERSAETELGEEFTDSIPWDWLCQAQQQMLVTGAEIVLFGVLVGGRDFRRYEVERSEAAIEQILPKLESLWKNVLTLEPPDFDYSHASAMETVKSMFPKINEGDIKVFSSEIGNAWDRYEELMGESNHLKKEAEKYKAQVYHALGESQAGQLPDGRYLRRKLIQKKPQDACEYIDTRCVKKL